MDAFLGACFSVAKGRGFAEDGDVRDRLADDVKVDTGGSGGGSSSMMVVGEEQEERQEAEE